MRTLLFISCFLVFNAAIAQNDALIRFQLSYSDNYRLSVSDINTDIDEAIAEGDGKDRVVDTFIGEMHRIFQEEYAPQIGINSMNQVGYPDKISIDPYGFPQASAKRAAKMMKAERYYAVEINMESANGILTSDGGGLTIKEVGLKGDKKKFRPRIEIRLIVFDAKGKRKNAVRAAAKAESKIVLKENAFLGIIPVGESKKLEDSQQVILDTFRAAMDKVVEKY